MSAETRRKVSIPSNGAWVYGEGTLYVSCNAGMFQSPQTGHGYTGKSHRKLVETSMQVSIPSNGAWVYGVHAQCRLMVLPNKVSIPSNGAWVYGARPPMSPRLSPRSFNPLKRGMGIRGKPSSLDNCFTCIVSIPSNGAWVYGAGGYVAQWAPFR